VPDTCVDCNDRPRLHDLGSSYTETFPIMSPSGAAMTMSLRLCLRCGGRFADRTQLREYLRTKIPQFAIAVSVAHSR
jgi:hypothetical protein